ncbi:MULTISPECIES: Rieske (2Fe-2S) protein [Paenibacillus]|uniref:Rieske (2Fe-2S) protein n=1 Tax=Paenibacillus TaxID=44249 RepID=UPI0022B8AA9A|nr:Rieske 2Fe-2S domain-containing protein [Paenibacillus caseinilyticus]MCZ8519921.1 Rieske 2Fe-2S domain-containing protein [Paenibacillus caseinilyticus]
MKALVLPAPGKPDTLQIAELLLPLPAPGRRVSKTCPMRSHGCQSTLSLERWPRTYPPHSETCDPKEENAMKEITLGPLEEFSRFPAEVEVESKAYYVLQEFDKYHLVSRTCPHAGAQVEAEDGELVCPLHGWTFSEHNGACLNVPVKPLASYPVTVRNGQLIARMEE